MALQQPPRRRVHRALDADVAELGARTHRDGRLGRVGSTSPSSLLRTCPSFEVRSSQAATPGRTPMVLWPNPLSTWH